MRTQDRFSFVAPTILATIGRMSSMTEIQEAIQRLPTKEKEALTIWLSTKENREMSDNEEAALLASLDQAAQQLDAGQGVPIDQVRHRMLQWATK